jgi:hypothetical protein
MSPTSTVQPSGVGVGLSIWTGVVVAVLSMIIVGTSVSVRAALQAAMKMPIPASSPTIDILLLMVFLQ